MGRLREYNVRPTHNTQPQQQIHTLSCFLSQSSTERHLTDEPAPPTNTTAATTPTSPRGGASGEGRRGGRNKASATTAGTGAEMRRQLAGDRAPAFPTTTIDRHTLRSRRSGKADDGAKSPLASSYHTTRGKKNGNMKNGSPFSSPKAGLQRGVFLAKTAGRLGEGGGERGSGGGVSPGWGRSAAASVGAGGAGPTVGSPQETALVLNRKVRRFIFGGFLVVFVGRSMPG